MHSDIRRKIIDFIRRESVRGRIPSVARLIKKVKINRMRFYELFPDGIAQAYKQAGVAPPKARIKVGKDLKLSRVSSRVRGDELSSKEIQFEREKKAYSKRLNGLYRQARADPLLVPLYAREIVPNENPELWRRFLLLSSTDIVRAYGESVKLNGTYLGSLKIEIAQGNQVKDTYKKFLGYVLRITNLWVLEAIRQRRGRQAEPTTDSGICSNCGNTYQSIGGVVKCSGCKGTPLCMGCGSLFDVVDMRSHLYECRGCGLRGWFDNLLSEPKPVYDLLRNFR